MGYIRTIYRADGTVESTTLLHGVTDENAAQLGVIDGYEEPLSDGRTQVTHKSERSQ